MPRLHLSPSVCEHLSGGFVCSALAKLSLSHRKGLGQCHCLERLLKPPWLGLPTASQNSQLLPELQNPFLTLLRVPCSSFFMSSHQGGAFCSTLKAILSSFGTLKCSGGSPVKGRVWKGHEMACEQAESQH